MNRQQRRAEARTHQRGRKATAVGSAAVLASAGAGAAIAFTSGTAGAVGTTYVVTTTADTTDGTCDADCSLRDAIDEANGNAGQDVITFSVTGTITLTANLPTIEDDVHINGPGATSLTIDGDDSYEVLGFYNLSGSNEVTGLTITNGKAGDGGAIQFYQGDADVLISDVVLTGNEATNDGGAIQFYSFDGTANLVRVTATGNVSASNGGGLYCDGDITLTISDSVFSDNTSAGEAGALYIGNGEVTITNTVITGNSADGAGGGIKVDDADAFTMIGSTVSGNYATGEGGGLYINLSSGSYVATITNSEISDNTALAGSGGIDFYHGQLAISNSTISGNSGGGYGGGLYFYGTSLTVVQSTITGNTAGENAGGVYVGQGGGARFLLSTVSANTATTTTAPNSLVHGIQVGLAAVISERRAARASEVETNDRGEVKERGRARASADPIDAGELTLTGTIVAGNGDLDIGSYDGAAVAVDSLGSIIGTVETALVTVTDAGGTQSGVAAAALKLGPLADNGGPTRTHALLPGSVAIDAGPATADLPTFPGEEYDQRGEPYARIVNGKVDVGAFEVQAETPPEPTFTG